MLTALGEAENDPSPSALRTALEQTEEFLDANPDDPEAHMAWEYSIASKIALRRFDEARVELPRLVDRYVELEESDDILEAPARLLAQWRRLPPELEFREYLAGQLRRFIPGGWLKPEDL
ncbi:hypothetical protein [Herbidospora cretacea]|uniref:hypothetical protein n=1 Tax=Herbidospora cretacea TaxID=28444 RepID=UPI0004C2FEB0|nr:hypothetical protein [Herbidospora cretacea]